MSRNRAYIQQRIFSETLLKAAEMQLFICNSTATGINCFGSALKTGRKIVQEFIFLQSFI